MTTKTITDDFRVYPGETLSFVNETGFMIEQRSSAPAPSLVIAGIVDVKFDAAAPTYGQTAISIGYGGFFDGSVVRVEANGVLRVTSTGARSGYSSAAVGFSSGSWSPDISNAGLWQVTSTHDAIGAVTWDAGPFVFENSGRFVVTAGQRAVGLSLANGGTVNNSGEIVVQGSAATGVSVTGWDSDFTNTGTIKAIATGGGLSTGVQLYTRFTAPFFNSGTIEAGYAIRSTPYSSFDAGQVFINTGALKGIVELTHGSYDVQNSGLITGAVLFGVGNDIYYGVGGTALSGVFGGSGKDSLTGGASGDLLVGDDGADTIRGGDGDDTISGGRDDDLLEGGAGVDTLSFETATMSAVVDLSAGTASSSGVDRITGFEVVLGGAFADDIAGSAGDDTLLGGAGNDRLSGRSGNDVLIGGAGSDFILGESGNDLIGGSDGDDFLAGQSGDDVLFGDNGADSMFGDEGADRLFGGSENDLLVGGAGGDVLVGEGGDDTHFGEDGNDLIGGGDGQDFLAGQAGDDVLYGDGGNDQLYGDDGADQLFGGDGADLLVGGGGADFMLGEGGNDLLGGSDGDDFLAGQSGDDSLYGDSGNDQLYGDEGADQLFGGDGADLLVGGAGADFMLGGADNDRLGGSEGDDFLAGQTGDDVMFGDAGRDTLFGDQGADKLFGGNEDDVLVGGDGADELYGETGADRIIGEGGADLLSGGAGADRFEFYRLGDSAPGAADRIVDFERGSDLIDISGIDANANAAGDQAFVFASAFSNQAGQAVLSFDGGTNTTTLRLDVNGDGQSDFDLLINGNVDSSSGFVL